MKEITRIHIAKVSYDIELSAKKALEKYIAALSTYASDDELLQDIEVRITELLAERGVGKDDIIADNDVQAVRAKLGEPEAFADDESEAVLPVEESSRRLYRDQDNAVVGGVLSGIAAFFRINPLWTRLAFIVSIFISFGTMLLVYIVLWLAVPPARTAAEKLRMSGRPVTLGSIREVSEQDVIRRPLTEQRVRAIKRIAINSLGIGFILLAIVAMVATVIGGWQLSLYTISPRGMDKMVLMIAACLLLLGGVFLIILAIMGAYAAFTRKLAKRQIISAIVIIVLGLATFGAGVGIVGYQSWQRSDATQRAVKTVTTQLPVGFAAIKTLKINAPGVLTQYFVTSGAPYMTLTSLPGLRAIPTLDGESATITVLDGAIDNYHYLYSMPVLAIYGPALSELQLAGGAVNYQTGNQAALQVRILKGASQSFGGDAIATINGGTIDTLSIVSEDSDMWSTIVADAASVRNVTAQLREGDSLELGKIASLNVTYPDVCATGARLTTVSVAGLQATTMTVNQKVAAAKTQTSSCGAVTFNQAENE
jgi:phage shock protein PspC (stress-responsive transcriptional regulator)